MDGGGGSIRGAGTGGTGGRFPRGGTERARRTALAPVLVLAVGVALAAAMLPACTGPSPRSGQAEATGSARPAETGSALRDLHHVSELKARFNADVGSTRLILLLSPT